MKSNDPICVSPTQPLTKQTKPSTHLLSLSQFCNQELIEEQFFQKFPNLLSIGKQELTPKIPQKFLYYGM